MASLYPEKEYNKLTGFVFQRNKPDTHGSVEFMDWVQSSVGRMVSARHSATGFYKSCARAVNVGFGFALGKVQGGMSGDVNKSSKLLEKGLAEVFPARPGSGLARFTVAATEPDTKGRQGALERVAGPVWQRAVDSEAEHIRLQIIEDYTREIRGAGFTVR